MIRMMFQRSFHTTGGSLSASKSSVLGKLRKSTGYPLSNCKKAIELYPEDLMKAEEWLHAEAKTKGWSKWAKIQTRTATQGVIGVCSKDNIGVMVEINCETDFVSRNAEFQQLVEKMLSGCINYASNLKSKDEITKELLDESQLSTIQCESSSLGELVAAATCKFNEKTVAKRAVCLKVPDDVLLSGLSHPLVSCPNLNGASLGKYGVLLASKKKDIVISEDVDTTEDVDNTVDVDSLRMNICHHVIGMNPQSIGQLTEKDIAKFSKTDSEESEITECVQNEVKNEFVQNEQKAEQVQADQSTRSECTDTSEDPEADEPNIEAVGLKESNETQLIYQSYLMDPTVTVGETLYKSGLEIVTYERFECGETAEELPDVAMAASG